jgi:hypothetical protein
VRVVRVQERLEDDIGLEVWGCRRLPESWLIAPSP